MKLEEAKEIIKSIDTLDDYELQEAIETVIGELFAMQNLLDEKNEEIERLQKEKAEYEASWNNTAHELRIFKNECVPKCNIREKIKMLKKIYELVNVESEADYCLRSKINILEDLLKEE